MLIPPPPAISIVLAALVIIAAAWDLRLRRIPNWLTVSGLILGVSLNSFLLGVPGLKFSLSGAGIAFGIYLLLYLFHAMGAGDVKLMAAVGAFAGPSNWLMIFLITSIGGGAIALIVIARRKRVRTTFDNVMFIAAEMMHFRPPYVTRAELSVKSGRGLSLPHGAVIGMGCLVFLSWAYFKRKYSN